MNILHAIPYLGKAQGGPVESLRLLASAQAEMGNRVRVVYTGIPADGELAAFPGNVEVIRIDSRGPSRWSPKLIDAACSNDFTPDVIHSHALWLDVGRQAARLSRKLDVPHIVSPCGMLQQDALLRSRWKKRIAWPVFQKQVLLTAEINGEAPLDITSSDGSSLSRDGIVEFIADSVITVHNSGIGGEGDRAIRVLKMRRTNHTKGPGPMSISKKGVNIKS